MALIHQNLYEDQNMAAIKVQPYFEKLIHSLYHSYRISEDNIALELEIAPLTLDVDTVIPLGLIVNELITNALKYAFPDHQRGTIGVLLAETGDTLTLQVRDDGVGMDYHQIETVGSSFGYRLIKAFQKQLKAHLDVRNDGGTSVRLTIKSYRKAAADNKIHSHKN
jgi:two-component sensor histidine kinase